MVKLTESARKKGLISFLIEFNLKLSTHKNLFQLYILLIGKTPK